MRSSSEKIFSELSDILKELSQQTSINKMSRRIQLCQKALSLISREPNSPLWAALQHELGNSLAQNPLGDRGENIEEAITTYKQALEIRTRTAMPVDWASTMNNLALVYLDRIRGDRGENIEEAITTYKQALEVRTRIAMPVDWAQTMHNLATAYSNRIKGDRGENIEEAITTYKQALEIRTRTAMPVRWAETMNNLATAYRYRIKGDRGENIEEAISAYKQTLEVTTQIAMPIDWAQTMDNLANAYSDRIRGDRGENIEKAITAYKQTLEVTTRTAMPIDWAGTMNQLAIAYCYRIRGERGENIEEAISAYKQALEVRTQIAMPVEWAITMNNLANAYSDRIRGDRGENIEKAITAYKQALEVTTRTAMPVDWAQTVNNLGSAYYFRIRGERGENIEEAISAYKQALEVRTRTAMPLEWASTMNNLAIAYCYRIRGNREENIEEAISAYKQVLEVRTRIAMPLEWAETMNNLGTAYSDRIRGKRGENIEEAISAYKQALEVRTRIAIPIYWAQTMNNLATAYEDRIRGERSENIEKAISAYKQALEIFHPEVLPFEFRKTARLLGNLYAEENNWSEATKQYQLALEAVEVLYESSLSLTGKEDELSNTGDLFHRTAYALVCAGHPESAILTLEKGRARNLSETLARDRADLERIKILAPEVYENYQQAAIVLRNLETQERIRSTFEAKNEVSVTPEEVFQQALEARQKLNKAIEQIRQISSYENFLASPTFEEISQALKPDEPLIYITTTEYGTISLFVNRTSTNNVSVSSVQLDTLTDTKLKTLLAGAKEEIELKGWFGAYFNRLNNRQAWLDTIDQVTNELWSKLMESIINHLKQMNMQQAILIPTGLLGLLPLHAAWTEDLDRPCGRYYALDEISLTYAPNARSLITARKIATRISHDVLLAVDEPRPVNANRLPNSKREVLSAIETFPNHCIFKHEQATQQAVKNVLSYYSVFHFSCHSSANFTEPLNSGLLMANDQILSLRDLLELNLDGVRLAVLSACETALPGTKLIDEVVSLSTGMLQAGVAGVVASLWSVSEQSTMLLLSKFYKLWRDENLSPKQALYQAQIWLRESTESEIAPLLGKRTRTPNNRPFEHPYYWAAFSYTGV